MTPKSLLTGIGIAALVPTLIAPHMFPFRPLNIVDGVSTLMLYYIVSYTLIFFCIAVPFITIYHWLFQTTTPAPQPSVWRYRDDDDAPDDWDDPENQALYESYYDDTPYSM